MGNLTKLNWPGGYYPSQDAINGNPDTLLRADNLQQEQDGAIALARGNRHVRSFNDVITNFYSKTYGGVDYVYAGVGNTQTVQEFLLDGTQRFSGDIISGALGRPVFGDAYGLVLACAGAQRKKFNGASVYQLGLETPTIPIRSKTPANVTESYIVNASEVDIIPDAQAGAAWSLDEGTIISSDGHSAEFYPDSTTNRGVLSCAFSPVIDVLNVAANQSTNPGNDTFFMDVQLDDPNAFSSIRVQLNLDADGKNYFWYEWTVPGSTEFSLSRDAWSKVSASRSQFNRQGNDVSLDWKTIASIQVTVNAVSSTSFVAITSPRFIGGIQGQLLGSYQYIYRWVKDMGTYLAKSPFSPASETFTVVNGSIFVLPHVPVDQSEAGGLQYCTVEIYRRSVPSTESYFNSLTGQFAQLPDILDQFYLVSEGSDPAGYVQDIIGDVEVLEEGTAANLFLDSIQNIAEPIIDILGVYNDRVLYLSATSLYLGERLNPDSYDVRYTLKFTGDPYDTNFWIKSINNATLMLGSNHDLYEISGSLLDLPDGTLDINVYAFGDRYPPISVDVAKVDGLLFYVASDGVRTTSGSNSNLLSPHLSQLFQGIDCHGVPGVQIFANGVQRYYITVGHGKLYVSLPHTDGLRRLHVYNLQKKLWTMRTTYVTGCHTTQTDKVIFAIGPEALLADEGTSYTNTVSQPINLLTVYDHDGTPRNRKDTETLKLVIDTGGVNLDVYLGVMKAAGTQMNFLQTINTSTLQTIYISLKSTDLSLGFRYALNLIGAALMKFKLVEYTIEYLPRPEQINYVRIPNSNLGTTTRKRFISIPFVIDTLGTSVTVTPIIDNIILTAQAQSGMLSVDQKQTLNFYFQQEAVGIDIGFIIEGIGGAPFELTGPDYNKAVSEVMPESAEFLLIPPSDFGSPNRKRSTSIKFELNTNGQRVSFTPRVDQVDYPVMYCNSGEDKKKIFEYFFDIALGDFTWFMLGGTLQSRTPTPFELYGGLIPQQLEIFPARLKSLYLAENNYGAAARKRLRTLPIIINTNGYDVTYQPYVDGVSYPPTVLNSAKKATVYHFFATDSFGIDYAGFLSGANPFEFYEMASPANVEVLPVPKKFDQLGPLRFDKIGKLFALRLRVVLVGTVSSIPFAIYGDNQEMDPTYDATPQYTGAFNIVPGEDCVVQANLPKSVNSTIFRITLGPTTEAFHRFDLQAKIQSSGMETDAKWVPIR